MSSEWEDAGRGDAEAHIWDRLDDAGWDFERIPADWSVFDEPPGASGSLNDPNIDPYWAALHVDHHAPPRPSQHLSGGGEGTAQTHGTFNSTSLRSMGNSASAAHTSVPPPPPQHASSRSPHHSTGLRRRPPSIGYSDNWLDRTTIDRPVTEYIPDHLFQTLDSSSDSSTPDSATEGEMPSRSRRVHRGSVIDLTAEVSAPQEQPPARASPRSLKRTAEEAERGGRGTKRSRTSPQDIDELDLTNEAPSAEEELLRAQQEQTISAQRAEEENSGPLKIGKRQCIICMEAYTNATVTHCGHIYCHECLTQALQAGEKNNDRGVGTCPVCRKPVNRKKANQVLPIAFMKKSAFKGKARKDVGMLG